MSKHTGELYPSPPLSNHTPGPWRLAGGAGHGYALIGADGSVISATGFANTANARLIEKAPQMHTLLRQAVDQFPDIEAGNDDIVDWLTEFVQRAHEVIDG